jgi:acyl-CoA synthetase (AMP-forming)/AMP-acid ligase II
MRLHDYLEFYARETPEKPFGEFEDVRLSYAEGNARANQLARALKGAGVGRGKRFAYLSKNSLDYVVVYLAAAKCGAVPVPLNYRLAPAEWAYIINDAEAALVLASADYLPGIEAIRESLTQVQTFVASGTSHPDWLEFESWIASCADNDLGDPIAETDQLYQMYTSGTTGLPKGVVISHRAITANLVMMGHLMPLDESCERFLVALPLYHAGGAVLSMMALSKGNELVVHEDFLPTAAVDALSHGGITRAGMVPAMIQACLVTVPDIAERDYSQLKSMGYGASPIAAETLRKAMQVFQCEFCQVFGMTETSALACGLMPADHQAALAGREELLRSAGRPALGTEIKIVEGGVEVPRGQVGEVAVRGPQIMDGYWNLPEATQSSLVDGWMMTGDAAYMDDEGYVYIQDRIKDMIVSGGENVYPAEVENVLFEHPDVGDAAVIGIPDERWGETILAFLVTRDGQLPDPQELEVFCRERLAGYKVPRRFELISELPRNASGKVLKKDLREPYWEGVDRRVG